MMRLSIAIGVTTFVVGAAPASGEGEWIEDFDAYASGAPLADQGGWSSGPPDLVVVTDAQQLSPPNALSIQGASKTGGAALRTLHEFDVTSGIWAFRAHLRIPSEAEGTSYFILLNTFDESGATSWSTQLGFDADAGEVRSDFDDTAVPIRFDRWAEIRVEIDLDRDLQRIHYDGQHVVTKSWSEGVGGSGQTALEAVDLYGNCCGAASSAVHYDDLSLRRSCAGDVDRSGLVDFGDVLVILSHWGARAPGPHCWFDLSGDGVVGFAELLTILGEWGACAG